VPPDDPTLSSTMVIRLIQDKTGFMDDVLSLLIRGCRGCPCGIVLGGCIEGVSLTGSEGARSWEFAVVKT
jgi:hypothetical protein